MAMRWKMAEREQGLYATIAPPSSHWLSNGGKRLACVSPIDRRGSGWYWVAGWDSSLPHMNTCDKPVPTVDDAKAAAMAYVRQHLAPNTEVDRASGSGRTQS